MKSSNFWRSEFYKFEIWKKVFHVFGFSAFGSSTLISVNDNVYTAGIKYMYYKNYSKLYKKYHYCFRGC